MDQAAQTGHNILSTLLGWGIFALFIVAAVAFFRGPAKRSEEYANTIAAQFTDPGDGALFMGLYKQKGAKSVVVAWLLTTLFSPTIAYLYLGENTKALIAFITLNGFFVWWVISLFSMPTEALAKNRKAADDALLQLRLMRPQLSMGGGGAWPPPPISPA